MQYKFNYFTYKYSLYKYKLIYQNIAYVNTNLLIKYSLCNINLLIILLTKNYF